MVAEIDLRSLINHNLKCEEHGVSPSSLGKDETVILVERTFETNKTWNKKEQTNYIESVFLNCSLQPIVRFKNDNHTIIVDGNNRYSTIKNFYNNELILMDSGLNQLKFLSNKKYSDLTLEEKNFFDKNAYIKILDYSCEMTNLQRSLTKEEENEILKYLYTIYNTGLKLEVEEIQRAQFYDDEITKQLREKMEQEKEFLELLENLKLYNGRRKRNKVDNILLNCRLLISSTYSNIYNFSHTPDIQTRIEYNYLPNINNVNKNKILEDFILNVNQIYNNLIDKQKWQKYPNLHSKPFIEATYWLLSIIRKDNLMNPTSFDFMKYLEHFGEVEEYQKNFDIYHSHYSKNIYRKYCAVAKYFEEEYNIRMDSYLSDTVPKNDQIKVIRNINELFQYNSSLTTEEVLVSNLITNLKNSSYNLRPYYQRKEIMNITLSSRIIESLLLGIKIPYLLMCDKCVSGNYVTEVVDGQQRLLSILAFVESPFMNESGELEYSNKNGYSLKNLRVLKELNNLSFQNKRQHLTKEDINKIMNSHLSICKTRDNNTNAFDTIDHFVRLNKKSSLIKENSYRMIDLTADTRIINYNKKAASEFLDDLLPKIDKNGKSYTIMLRLSYLFYNKLYSDINISNYSNLKVTSWLNEFNKFKDDNMYRNQEAIEGLRIKYYNSINETKKFLKKLKKYLLDNNESIRELVCLNHFSNIPLSYYYYLFCFFNRVSEDTLVTKSKKIEQIVQSFFKTIKEEKMFGSEVIEKLKFYVKQMEVLDTNNMDLY